MATQRPEIDMTGLRGRMLLHAPMHQHVSWKAGGAADVLYVPADLDDWAMFLRRLPRHEPVHRVGLGSNLLVRDGGVRGVVIVLHGALRELHEEAASVGQGMMYAEAGVALPRLARFSASCGLVGGEFMVGIPGTVGGALAMNAGCYGGETWNVVARVLTMRRDGSRQVREREEFSVGYREVRGMEQDEWFAAGWFVLARGNGQAARELMADLLRRRVASQPLGQPNAGSVFRNPPGDHAARLIEQCGLKGWQIGAAQVSRKHANFIVNTGGASASDIERLIEHVGQVVEERTGVRLLCEVRIIGERLEEAA